MTLKHLRRLRWKITATCGRISVSDLMNDNLFTREQTRNFREKLFERASMASNLNEITFSPPLSSLRISFSSCLLAHFHFSDGLSAFSRKNFIFKHTENVLEGALKINYFEDNLCLRYLLDGHIAVKMLAQSLCRFIEVLIFGAKKLFLYQVRNRKPSSEEISNFLRASLVKFKGQALVVSSPHLSTFRKWPTWELRFHCAKQKLEILNWIEQLYDRCVRHFLYVTLTKRFYFEILHAP